MILFVTALDTLPLLIQHLSRLRNIGRRMESEAPDPAQPAGTSDRRPVVS